MNAKKTGVDFDETTESRKPWLSVVVVFGEEHKRLSKMLSALTDQTISDQLEAVFVNTTPPPYDGVPNSVFPIKHIYVPSGTLPGRARYQGLQAASSKNIAFLEDHCYPEKYWAEALVKRHSESWDAIGYTFKNGSPDTFFYQSALLAEYGHWLFPHEGGQTTRLPGCNVSFKKAAMDCLGTQLPGLLEMDFNLHQALLHRNAYFYVEPNAIVHHECYLHFKELLVSHLLFCRLQVDRRIKAFSWSWKRRLLFGFLTPILLPPLQVFRFVKAHHRNLLSFKMLLAFPLIYMTYQFDALGESIGCFLGAGQCEKDFSKRELNALRATRLESP